MSNYITAVVCPDISLREINRIGQKNNLSFTPIENSFVKEQLSDNNIQYYLIEWIENEYNIPVGKMETLDTERKTLKHLSAIFYCFGNSFVQRAEEEKKRKQYALQQSLQNWTGFLKNFFAENSDSKIGLLSHWYTGLIAEKKLSIKKVSEIVINDFKECCAVEHMEDDVLYIFTYQNMI